VVDDNIMEIINKHIIEVFRDLFMKKESGILRAEKNNIKKYFYFKEGNLVFAHSNILSEKLGEIMIKLGFIERKNLTSILLEKPRGARLGLFLLNKGLITYNELQSALVQQVKKICFNAFRWEIIPLEFERNDNPVYEDLRIQLSTADLIIEGIYQINEPEILFSDKANFLNYVIEKIEDETVHLPRIELNTEETLILSLIEEGISIRELLSKSGLPYKMGLLSIYSLYIQGIIKFVDKKVKIKKEEEISALPDLSTEEKINEYVNKILPQLYKINYYDLLCVEPDEDINIIQKNYDYFMDHLQPYYYSDHSKSWQANLKYVIDYFNEAFDTLVQPSNRKEYDQKLKDGKIEERRIPSSEEEEILDKKTYSFEIHPVDVSSDKVGVKSQPFKELETKEMPPLPSEGIKYVEYLFRQKKFNEAYQALNSIEAINKKESKFHFLMGAILANFPDKNKEAEEYLLRAYAMEPKNPEYLLHLGLFYKSIGLGLKAFKFLNEVLKIDPNNKSAKDALGLRSSILEE